MTYQDSSLLSRRWAKLLDFPPNFDASARSTSHRGYRFCTYDTVLFSSYLQTWNALYWYYYVVIIRFDQGALCFFIKSHGHSGPGLRIATK